jgi:hypothetical protein
MIGTKKHEIEQHWSALQTHQQSHSSSVVEEPDIDPTISIEDDQEKVTIAFVKQIDVDYIIRFEISKKRMYIGSFH